MKIRFLKNYKVKAFDGPTYVEGQVVDLNEPAARHFLNRQVAVEVAEGAASAPPEPPAPKPDHPRDDKGAKDKK